jgi:hypothetical protein
LAKQTLRAVAVSSVFLIQACGHDEAPAESDAPPPAQVDTAGQDSYANNPPPLLTPPAAQKPKVTSAADLPPLETSILATAPDRIYVTVRDPLPVSAAMLVDPQGHQIDARRIDHDRIAYGGSNVGWPSIGVGVMGGSNSGVSTGIGIGFPLFPGQAQAAGSINESRFGFVVPDVAAYNASWQHWKIHIDLSNGVTSRSFETLPPAPPRG